jgi:hypothetical protein
MIVGVVQWIIGIWIIERLEKRLNAALRLSAEMARKLQAMDERLGTIINNTSRDWES